MSGVDDRDAEIERLLGVIDGASSVTSGTWLAAKVAALNAHIAIATGKRADRAAHRLMVATWALVFATVGLVIVSIVGAT